MVITGLTRNQFASNRTWVRIPSSPPTEPLKTQCFQGFQLFSAILFRVGAACCLMVTVQPKKILHSLRFFVLRTIASLIFIPTILLLCTVSIIKPLALHNAGDRRNAVPCAALGCMKFALVFLTLFFQRCNLHSDPTSFPVCSATPRFQLRFRPCDLWRSPASGWRPAAPSVCAVCISCNPSCSRH